MTKATRILGAYTRDGELDLRDLAAELLVRQSDPLVTADQCFPVAVLSDRAVEIAPDRLAEQRHGRRSGRIRQLVDHRGNIVQCFVRCFVR